MDVEKVYCVLAQERKHFSVSIGLAASQRQAELRHDQAKTQRYSLAFCGISAHRMGENISGGIFFEQEQSSYPFRQGCPSIAKVAAEGANEGL